MVVTGSRFIDTELSFHRFFFCSIYLLCFAIDSEPVPVLFLPSNGGEQGQALFA